MPRRDMPSATDAVEALLDGLAPPQLDGIHLHQWAGRMSARTA